MAGPTSPGCVPPDRRRQRPCGGQRRRGASGALVVFDVLHLDARAARELPYRERRAMLQELVGEHARRCLAPASTERLVDVTEVKRAHGARRRRRQARGGALPARAPELGMAQAQAPTPRDTGHQRLNTGRPPSGHVLSQPARRQRRTALRRRSAARTITWPGELPSASCFGHARSARPARERAVRAARHLGAPKRPRARRSTAPRRRHPRRGGGPRWSGQRVISAATRWPRKRRSRGSHARGSRTPRSARACSSARERAVSLQKVFGKLDISSRAGLQLVLGAAEPEHAG